MLPGHEGGKEWKEKSSSCAQEILLTAHWGHHQATAAPAVTARCALTCWLYFVFWSKGRSLTKCHKTCFQCFFSVSAHINRHGKIDWHYTSQFPVWAHISNVPKGDFMIFPNITGPLQNTVRMFSLGHLHSSWTEKGRICNISEKINIMFVLSCLIPTQKMFSLEVVGKSYWSSRNLITYSYLQVSESILLCAIVAWMHIFLKTYNRCDLELTYFFSSRS